MNDNTINRAIGQVSLKWKIISLTERHEKKEEDDSLIS